MRLKPAYILLPIAGLIALGLMAQKKAAGFLNMFIDTVSIAFSGLTPVIRVNIAIQNPSNEQFVIKSLVANLKAGEKLIGNVSSFDTIVINPNAQIIYPVFIRLGLVAIVQDIITLIQNRSGPSQTLELSGHINANGIVSPLELSYKIL